MSLSEARGGHAAKTTASRSASGGVVGSSSGSNYVRQQEAQKAQAARNASWSQTPGISSAYQQQNQRLSAQMRAVEAERARRVPSQIQTNAKKYTSVQKASLLYGAGKRLASGEELSRPMQDVVDSYKPKREFEYSKASEWLDDRGKAASAYLGKVTRKDAAVRATDSLPVVGSVVKGVYDVTDVPSMAGNVAMGVERWAQKPKTIAPSIPIGAGMVSKSVTSDPIRFATSLVFMEGLGRGVKKINPIHVRSTKLQEVTPGEAAAVRDINLGYTASIGKKPIVSYSKSSRKFQKGTLSADKKMLEGKQVQAFTKADTKAFEKTLKQFDQLEQDYFAAGKKIAETAYKQKSPITKPKELEVLSAHVAADMKPIVKQTIKDYGSKAGRLVGRDIQVYGSVPQKLQMSGYFSRTPKDIEISVNSVDKFVSMFRKNATANGFKEGVNYRVTGEKNAPKIEFRMNDKWEKGIEVFSHKKTAKGTIEAAEGVGYRSESGIAFGFKGMKSIKADSVKMMKLQEQSARKFAGGTTLKDGKIDLVHGGRVKDVRDLIEIGTAYEVTKRVGISKDVVQYAQIAAKRHPEILESPIVKYIVDNGKLPTKTKIAELMAGDAKAVADVGNALKGGTAKDLELMFSSTSVNISKTISKGVSDRSKTAFVRQASGNATPGDSSGTDGGTATGGGSGGALSIGVRSRAQRQRASSKPISSKTTSRKSTSSKTASSKTSVRKGIPRGLNSKTLARDGGIPTFRQTKRKPFTKTAKRKKVESVLETDRDLYRMKRTIRNTLGDMDSFFGGSPREKRTTKLKSKK